jgi:aspartate kinase
VIVSEAELESYGMERQVITGIAYDKNEARITLTALPDSPGAVASVFGPLAQAGINHDMIVRAVPRAGVLSDLTFTVPRTALAQASDVLGRGKAQIGYADLLSDATVTKLSIVGVGLRSDPEIAALMFRTLADRKIDLLAITASEIKVSVLIPEDYTELAVRVLHTAFGLDDSGAAA